MGAIAGFSIVRASCETKCDDETYFTPNTGAPMDMQPWYGMTSQASCIRQYITDSKIDNFTDLDSSTQKMKVITFDSITLGCWGNGGTYGVGYSPTNLAYTGNEIDITCWEECVEFPPE
jgi:hypothetical protein